MSSRFRDYQTRLFEFERDILVKCPQCNSCTKIASIDDGSTWRIACFHCSYTKTTSGTIKQYGWAIDPLFDLPLWLQMPCCGEVLWAYNAAHLEFLEKYVQATLRESQGNRWQHLSIAVRLPRWMKLASHRKAILKGIQHLKDRLE